MDLQLQQKIVVQTLEDAKGQDIQVFDTQPLTSLFDRVVIVSATSGRHTRALADQLGRKAKEYGIDIVATEGEDGGEWVLIDLGDIIVHCMQPAIRDYYRLEEIWGDHPISLEQILAQTLPEPDKLKKKKT